MRGSGGAGGSGGGTLVIGDAVTGRGAAGGASGGAACDATGNSAGRTAGFAALGSEKTARHPGHCPTGLVGLSGTLSAIEQVGQAIRIGSVTFSGKPITRQS